MSATNESMKLEQAIHPSVASALAYSRNFAEASPYLTKTAKEHILGLCRVLEATEAKRIAASAGVQRPGSTQAEPVAIVEENFDIQYLPAGKGMAAGTRLYLAPPPVTSREVPESETLEYKEAASLATALWRRYYREAAPNWGLCDTTRGVISQIDNMVSGLRPDGWQLVPKEPTQAMVICGFEAASEFRDSEEFEEMSGCQGSAETAKITWREMLAAAPQPEGGKP